jgi:PilZ domain
MDLSVAGLSIKTIKRERLGAKAHLHFLIPEGNIRAEAVVRHLKQDGGMGLKFQAISERDRPNLAALMRRLRSLS